MVVSCCFVFNLKVIIKPVWFQSSRCCFVGTWYVQCCLLVAISATGQALTSGACFETTNWIQLDPIWQIKVFVGAYSSFHILAKVPLSITILPQSWRTCSKRSITAFYAKRYKTGIFNSWKCTTTFRSSEVNPDHILLVVLLISFCVSSLMILCRKQSPEVLNRRNSRGKKSNKLRNHLISF